MRENMLFSGEIYTAGKIFTLLPAVIVVTRGIKQSSNIGNALVSAMYGQSSELGLYLWGN